MTKLLIKLFIKNNDPSDPVVRKKYGIVSGFVGIICNALLCAAKFLAGIISGSVAITADALNNLSDAGSSVITLFGFYLSGKKPDAKHPFGYGRVEYISGLIISMIIILVGIELIPTSIDKITSKEPVVFSWLSLGILILSVLVKLWMGAYNLKIGKIIDSQTMKAVAFDSISDVISTTVVAISLILSAFISFPIDGYLGILVAAFIIYGGFKSFMDTINPLLGQSPDPEMVYNLENRILSYPAITGVHDVIVHNYGPGRVIASLHAEIPADMDIIKAHEQIDLAEKEIASEFGLLLVIHLDPIVNNEQTKEIRQLVKKVVKGINPTLSIHDFRMVDGERQINLIFDVVVPHGFRESDDEVKRQIDSLLKIHNPCYNTVITIDRNYIGYVD